MAMTAADLGRALEANGTGARVRAVGVRRGPALPWWLTLVVVAVEAGEVCRVVDLVALWWPIRVGFMRSVFGVSNWRPEGT